MQNFRRQATIVLCFVAIMTLLVIGSFSFSFASASDLNSPLQTDIAGTLQSVGTHTVQTLNAGRTKAAQTFSAVKTKIPATVQAVGTKVVSTVDAGKTQIASTLNGYKTSIPATLTALAPTFNAYKSNFEMTATAFSPTANAFSTNIPGTLTAVAQKVATFDATFGRTPIPGAEAQKALTDYAATKLGITVSYPTAAGGSRNIVGTFPLPPNILNAESVSTNLAVQTYYGATTNSAAWLAVGTGSVTGSGGTTVNVQDASLGVYTLNGAGSAADANAALALAIATYPDLANLTYSPATVEKGYAFYARTVTTVIVNGTATATPETVILYVLPSTTGHAYVTAAVGSGEYSTVLHP